MAIISITAQSATTTYATLSTGCTAGQYLYLFGDTTVRLRKAGGGASEWIPVAGSVSPRPFYLGTNVAATAYEVGTGTGNIDVKIVVTDHLLQ